MGVLGEGRAAGQTETLENIGDLVAANVVLWSQAQDADLQQAVTKDKLGGHQMRRAEAGRGELEEKLNERDVQFEMGSQTIEQLEG